MSANSAETRTERFALVLGFSIAAIPTIMAITTWVLGARGLLQSRDLWNYFQPPTLLLELVAILMAVGTGFRPGRNQLGLPGLVRVAVIALLAIDLGAGYWAAPERDLALVRSALTLLHLLFGFATAYLVRTLRPTWRERWWWLLAVGATLYVLALAAFVASIDNPAAFPWINPGLGVLNIRHIGFYAIIGAALAITLATISAGRNAWIAATAMATICIAEFFWSGSRAPALTMLVAPPLAALLAPSLRTPRYWGAWITAMVGGAALSFVHHVPMSSFGLLRMFGFGEEMTSLDHVSSGRTVFWERSIAAALHRPFFGYGEDQFIYLADLPENPVRHPHNLFFQVLVQWGSVGLILTCALGFWTWRALLRCARAPNVSMLPGFVALTAWCCYALFDGLFFFVYPCMMLGVLLALSLSITQERPA